MLPLCSSGCADGPGPGTAPGGDAPDQQVFPEAFWGLDPLFWLHVKLFIADILALQRHPRGPVDDGSATIPCAHWQNVSPLLELGTLVRMSGKVGQWRDQWQITVYNIDAIDDLNTEMLHWLEILSLKRAVYDKPFVLPPAMQEKATELEQSLSVTDLADDVGKVGVARFDFDALDPSETNEAAFKQAIMQHVEDSGMTEFLYTAMRSSPEMENRAKKVLLYQVR
ncbi:hypothetical protein BC936DRAFT_139161 [Jimgerdemannia flammicorona]|uniref:CST complex subunit Stn1 N-terminal domain-containing protein n=1 Tax=Jimgerdemannia flammicorona TaxID=994334 RepID=A0A433BAI9_9FUNG|nr:hypothetical protein BC936DRAFT_139161 [Jimgerdemannia flammicorona]